MQKKDYDLLELFFIFFVSFGLVFIFNLERVYVLFSVSALIIILIILRKQGLQKYGLSLKQWKESMKLSLIISVVALAFLVFIKPFADIGLDKFSLWWLIPYIFISVPLQEFVFRGYTQTRLADATVNKAETIILTSFAFAIFHFPSTSLVAMTFIIGLIWGYLFNKYKTLTGP